MELKELPNEILEILHQNQTPERLKRHLQIVYSTAYELVVVLEKQLPNVKFNKSYVLFGAATHDIGKINVPSELFESGKTHEKIGEEFLLDLGFSTQKSRFARTHGHWEAENLNIEDLLVCLSDKVWKGKRVEGLESRVRDYLIKESQLSYWDVYFELDALLEEIASKADKHLMYQAGI